MSVSMATSTSSSSESHSQNAGSSFPTFLQSNIPVPGKLDLRGNLAVNWKKFRRIWENYEIATHLNKQDSSLRVATLLSCIGSDVLDIFDGLSFDTEADRQDINKVLEKLEAYCIGETNETYERYVFNKRDQQQGESFDSYLSALRSLMVKFPYSPILYYACKVINYACISFVYKDNRNSREDRIYTYLIILT